MIVTKDIINQTNTVEFILEDQIQKKQQTIPLKNFFQGTFLESFYLPQENSAVLYIGCGKEKELTLLGVKEIFAQIAKQCKEYHIAACGIDFSIFLKKFGEKAIIQAVLGLSLGNYTYCYLKKEDTFECQYEIGGLSSINFAKEYIKEALDLAKSIQFARDMVNTPGNHLRPMDFNRAIKEYVEDIPVEVETLVYGQLKAMGMEGLYGIGGSSEYPPCLMILRYQGNPKDPEIYGLIGKGVTCDTGGYCLKSAKSMAGIKGDMAGAAAVVGAIHAIAMQKLPINVVACLPLCENRISQSSHLPGDVIKSYQGKTIEILNTDAEGRLILADAMSYGIRNEGITKVLDIATLTGAVWSALGFTIAGAMSNDDSFYQTFEQGLSFAQETYLRFPYHKEHEKMIKSNVADIKNIGADCCGAITAGLFIKEFCEDLPWIHLDIAGTAWSDTPQYAFDDKGATGAGVTAIYYMLKQAANIVP